MQNKRTPQGMDGVQVPTSSQAAHNWIYNLIINPGFLELYYGNAKEVVFDCGESVVAVVAYCRYR